MDHFFLLSLYFVLGLSLLKESIPSSLNRTQVSWFKLGFLGQRRFGAKLGFNFIDQKESAEDGKDVEEYYLTQTLDHFNSSDDRTWKQRYFVNKKFFNSSNNGPVFLIVGGDSEGEPGVLYLSYGYVDLAKKLGALMFFVEHRYYGKSQLTKDLSVKNLKYLSSRQALKDLEAFTIEMTRIYTLRNNKWVAFGASYPGNLAAWFRLKFPHHVHAAVASSAPVQAVVNFKEYFKTAAKSIVRKDSYQCANKIFHATRQIRTRVNGDDVEWQRLKKLFSLCDPMPKTYRNVELMYYFLSFNPDQIVQDNEVYVKEGSSTHSNTTITDMCNILLNKTSTETGRRRSAMKRYADMINYTYEKINHVSKPPPCYYVNYEDDIKVLREEKWTSQAAQTLIRQWTYQTCTEFGYFQTSIWGKTDIFGYFPVDYFVAQCRDIFGVTTKSIYKSIAETNKYYGGKSGFLRASNIIFINGRIDPWHTLGITKEQETSRRNTVIFIPDTAHGADYLGPTSQDSPSLKSARMFLEHRLRQYLNKE